MFVYFISEVRIEKKNDIGFFEPSNMGGGTGA